MADLDTSTRFQWTTIGFETGNDLLGSVIGPEAFAVGNCVYVFGRTHLVEYNTVTEEWNRLLWSRGFNGSKAVCTVGEDAWVLGKGTGPRLTYRDETPFHMWKISVAEQSINAVTAAAGTHPRARKDTTLNYLPAAGEMVLYSGWNYPVRHPAELPQRCGNPNFLHVASAQIVAFNVEGRTWRTVETAGQAPSTRERTNTCTNNHDTIFVYGGFVEGKKFQTDLFLLTWSAGGVLTWSSPQLVGYMPVRVPRCKLAYVGSRLFIFSGRSGFAKKGNISVADLEENRWYRIRRLTEPLDDAYPLIGDDYTYSSSSCVVVNNKLYVFGSNQQEENFGRALIPLAEEAAPKHGGGSA